MDKKPVFKTFGITKQYGKHKALDSVDMTVYEGDIYGFVGENGAGKTTLIRLASGLIKKSGGDYTLFGVSKNEPNFFEAKSKTAAIVESVTITKGLTALENLRLHCEMTGTKKADEELIQLINDVGLNYKEIEKKQAGSFSLGMRQRLGLATVLISDPKFVLLDEPMNGLDPQGFVDIRETILRLNKKGVTFLISSHILAELDKICTRVGFLSRGHLVTELSIDELHEKARKKIIIRAHDVDHVLAELKKAFKIQEVKFEGESIFIYDAIDINDIMKFFVEKNIKILSLSFVEETIEDFYSQLMREGSNL